MAGGCCRNFDEALGYTLEQNYLLLEGLGRREARESLRLIDGYATVKGAASDDGLAALKSRVATLAEVVGQKNDDASDAVPAGYTPIEDLLTHAAANV